MSLTATTSTRSRNGRRLGRLMVVAGLLAGTIVTGGRAAAQANQAVDGNLVPVVSARLLDTRPEPDLTTIDGLFKGGGKIAAGTFVELQVAGRGGVDPDADAVMLNVTAVFPEGPGYLTVFPCTPQVPHASNVNYFAGQVRPNSVLAKLTATGTVCIFTLATSHVVVDVNGYIPEGGAPIPVEPARLVETRQVPHETTIDGVSQGIGRAAAGQTIEFQVTGRGVEHDKVPGNAEAVFLNVTAIVPSGPGHLTVFPCGSPVPDTSNVNYGTGDITPNAVMVTIGAGGKVCIFTHAAADIIADVNGYFPPGGSRVAIQPARCADTRFPDGRTFDGLFQGAGPIAAGGTYAITIAGRCRIAADASAAYLNVTAVLPDDHGFITVWPCDEPRPNASNVNYIPGEVRPNAALSKVSLDGNGQVCVFSSARTNVIVDVTGYVPQLALRGIVDIDQRGSQHGCALLNTGVVQCWGAFGLLGDGTNDTRSTPKPVKIGPATKVVTGDLHSCALLVTKTVACWGLNQNGELGDGTNVGDPGISGGRRATPVAVKNLTNVVDVGAGGHHTCAVTGDGKVWCWGYNWEGQLGDGTNQARLTPVQVAGLPAGRKATTVDAGSSFTCALLDDGTVACWGLAHRLGVPGANTKGPLLAEGLTDVTAITVGYNHSCARISDGTVKCWGLLGHGNLGPGSTNGASPTTVTGVSNVAHVSAGFDTTCVTSTSGTARCWGQNIYGQLGDGSPANAELMPVQMTGFDGPVTVAKAGYNISCAVLADTSAVCWGRFGHHQLSGSPGIDSATPVLVGGAVPAG